MIEIIQNRYAVSAFGVVYSLINNAGNPRKSPKALKPYVNPETGYEQISLALESGVTTGLVHRLVALAYVPNPENKPEVNHIDGVKTNNAYSNLEWVTTSENALHAFELGLRIPSKPWLGKTGKDCPNSRAVIQMDLFGNFIQEFPSMADAQRAGFSQGNISSVISGKRKSHKGYLWAFA